jgi:hypothetical protein
MGVRGEEGGGKRERGEREGDEDAARQLHVQALVMASRGEGGGGRGWQAKRETDAFQRPRSIENIL